MDSQIDIFATELTDCCYVWFQGLVTLNFLQEKKEADFRYGLVRVRENAESIAFYGGEENELQLLLQRFRSAFENLTVWNHYFYLLFILMAINYPKNKLYFVRNIKIVVYATSDNIMV